MQLSLERSRSTFKKLIISSLARCASSEPRVQKMVGSESSAVSGIVLAVSRTGCWWVSALIACVADDWDCCDSDNESVRAGGIARGAKGGFRAIGVICGGI